MLPNLGYFLTASLNVPVWDWGTLRSKLRQSEYKRDSAKLQLSQTQREILSSLYSDYNEATVARSSVETLRQTADLAAESLRLVTLRYQGGLSTVFEVSDAETTQTQARNAYDDALVRYRTALAILQTLTGAASTCQKGRCDNFSCARNARASIRSARIGTGCCVRAVGWLLA